MFIIEYKYVKVIGDSECIILWECTHTHTFQWNMSFALGPALHWTVLSYLMLCSSCSIRRFAAIVEE